jgi:ParB-like chromosome segregation protein Spo0J
MAPGFSTAVVVTPAVLGEALRPLRLGGEEAVARMAESLARHGQLTAVTAFAPAPERLEIADGFKRLAAARQLEWPALRVEVLDIDVIQAKAALALLNQASALSELEEAWVVRSLHREDHLTQPQIGRLLRRHKAWVCRRLALAEGLDEIVEADVRLGLLAARAGYEVTRLPRGNQREVAEVVVQRGLTVAQTARLVSALLACTTPGARQALLREAREGTGMPPARLARLERSPAEKLIGDIGGIARLAARLQAQLLSAPLSALGESAAATVERALVALEPVLAALSNTIADVRGGRHAHVA